MYTRASLRSHAVAEHLTTASMNRASGPSSWSGWCLFVDGSYANVALHASAVTVRSSVEHVRYGVMMSQPSSVSEFEPDCTRKSAQAVPCR